MELRSRYSDKKNKYDAMCEKMRGYVDQEFVRVKGKE